MAIDLDGAVALVTSGANGIGAAAARRPAARGARVVVADVDERGARTWRPPSAAGSPAATCASRRTTRRRSPPLSPRSAASTWPHQRRSAPTSVRLGGPAWDLAAYRRAFGINVDGVFFGVNAALPALQARGRGALVLTSSLAGLTAVPGDPIYAATKHAVVGLARALGPALAADHIAVNALCPGFADTAINEPVRHLISAAGIPLMTADEVADALLAILASDRTGEAWYVQPGRPAEPFAFRNVPGPRAPDGSRIGGVPGMP
jgi:NAD(P)-dependent dehydrogenase (short-subunit alcohol dehydrogenase family)